MASKVDSSGLSVISEDRSSARKHHDGSDDYGSVYNQKARSTYGGGSKKKLHPLLLGPSRQHTGRLVSLHAASKNNLSEFTQRIMSAKLLRVKQVQNQLNETQIHLNELINENRTLKNLQKRQEGALRRYEGNHAELPQLIRSHNEEIRTLKANNKIIKAQLKETNSKLKDRENELESLKDSYTKLKKLSSEKNLLDREKLQKKVDELQDVVKEQESKIQVLSRKILLESKNYRHHLNIELLKHKETQKDLNSALTVISKLEGQLIAKEKPLPGNKVLVKRDNKVLMPAITNKSAEIQPKVGVSEDSFLSRDDKRRKSQSSDSPESELELLNGIGSSDITPSPTQDIFPDINKIKRSSPEIEIKSEIALSNSEIFHHDHETRERHSGTLKPRKPNLIKRISRFSFNAEENAKVVVERLNEDMEEIENLAQKVDSNFSISSKQTLRPINSFETKSFEPGTEKDDLLSDDDDDDDDEEKRAEEIAGILNDSDEEKEVPKKKLDDGKEADLETKPSNDFNLESELTESQQQKLENMTKTWNNIKSKIQEERKKAEEKMKELKKIKTMKNNFDDALSDAETEKADEESPRNDEINLETQKELRFVNFTDDSYILKELEKTDKIFNQLKNEKQKAQEKTSFSPVSERKSKTSLTPKPKPKPQPNIKNFRTESQKNPKYLEDFQNEFQKQNLLKALKAIDVGKDPNLSTEESEDSEIEPKKERFTKKNGLKRIQKFSSDKSNKELMAELFRAKNTLDKNENVKLELGATINE